MENIKEQYDAVIIGAGHAGCEAALAAARLGLKTIVFTVSIESVALMPCNPNIGGTSKGHLVREIDAMGGEMGKNIDRTFIQSKMLNSSKGPAVHSLRAQADKSEYSRSMRKILENTEGLELKQAEVSELMIEDGCVKGVKTRSGAIYEAKTVVICTGVYLRSRCIYGDVSNNTGPNGLQAANYLSDSLTANGIKLVRFKTGTPARIDGRTIDYSKMQIQNGDVPVVPFSFSTDPDSVQIEQVPCYLTHTTKETHEIIRANIDRSPLFSGAIEGTGPRYCPSIEDKVVKFSEKESHHVFIEPEGRYTNEMYIDGMSSSLPEDVQYRMYRSVPGLENAHIVRNAYAIEYDCIDPTQLDNTLQFKDIAGLFAAGQFNGSSGYEEAAAQGLLAGINAAMFVKNREFITIDRSEGYLGVLVDDLVTKGTNEPYRMMTSRAEYRLLLRQDNADIRLREKGYQAGLISEEQYQALLDMKEAIKKEIDRVSSCKIGNGEAVEKFLEEKGCSGADAGTTIYELIKRPELDYDMLSVLDPERPELSARIREQVNIEIKYKGYIERQNRQVAKFRHYEKKKIPKNLDYSDISGLRIEATQKLNSIRPSNVGQASRISGVSPADIAVLIVYLEKLGR